MVTFVALRNFNVWICLFKNPFSILKSHPLYLLEQKHTTTALQAHTYTPENTLQPHLVSSLILRTIKRVFLNALKVPTSQIPSLQTKMQKELQLSAELVTAPSASVQ